ncbi:MAG: Rieske 2Fe-2S domain-containing protein [Myxococcota bacterium]
MVNFINVAKASSVAPGMGTTVEVDGKPIALFNVGGKFYAIDNTCKHRGGPLGEGELEGTIVTCPWHGWQYDVTSGVCQMNPNVKLACYAVAVEGDDVKVAAD